MKIAYHILYCSTCKESKDEEKTEFIDIEENIYGEDVLTFICPDCKKEQKSTVRRKYKS